MRPEAGCRSGGYCDLRSWFPVPIQSIVEPVVNLHQLFMRNTSIKTAPVQVVVVLPAVDMRMMLYSGIY